MTARIEARPDCPAERRTIAAAEVPKAVKDTVGTSIDVVVVDPETLARSMGKLKRIYDHRDRA